MQIPRLRRVLKAYSVHNPAIGYCQVGLPYSSCFVLHNTVKNLSSMHILSTAFLIYMYRTVKIQASTLCNKRAWIHTHLISAWSFAWLLMFADQVVRGKFMSALDGLHWLEYLTYTQCIHEYMYLSLIGFWFDVMSCLQFQVANVHVDEVVYGWEGMS